MSIDIVEDEELIVGSEGIIDMLAREAPFTISRSGYPFTADRAATMMAVKKESDPSEMTAKFTIVTRQAEPNLHNNKVQITKSKLGGGLLLHVHKAAPIVLFEHGDFPFPIGVSERKQRNGTKKHLIKLSSTSAEAEVIFSQSLPEAAVIFGLVDEGIVRMSSIGFLPMKGRRMDMVVQDAVEGVEDLMSKFGGIDFVESLLLEWSVVGRGADQGAFRQVLDKGHICGQRVTPGLRPVLQRLAGPKTVWSPGADLSQGQSEGVQGPEGGGKVIPGFTVLQAGEASTSEHGRIAVNIAAMDETQLLSIAATAELDMNLLQKLVAAEVKKMVGASENEEEQAIVPDLLNRLDVQVSRFNSVVSVNQSVKQLLDIQHEHLEPSSLFYDWASRYCDCQVKELHNLNAFTSNLYMGSWLTGLKNTMITMQLETEDIRNLRGTKEVPPEHEVIQLNSTMSDDFLVDGIRFLKRDSDDAKIVVMYQPTWNGLRLRCFTSHRHTKVAQELLHKTYEWLRQHNFLKGEAFSLSGRFLPKTDETWDDVFLKSSNLNPIHKLVADFKKKKENTRKRGLIFMGPPGTGKTMSGRIIRNLAKDVTFIWVSSRDFYYMGAFGGFTYAMDLARDLSPAIIFFEDVDSWMSPSSVDVLKTEMDGISQKEGIATILTTNFPERLPEALLDRPGRFDDVLKFDLPDAPLREQMFKAWLTTDGEQSLKEKDVKSLVKSTEGYSGAHLRELVTYALALQEDDEDLSVEAAIKLSIDKIKEQRKLIDEVQLAGSNYNPHKQSEESVVELTMVGTEVQEVDDTVGGEEGGGLDLSVVGAGVARELQLACIERRLISAMEDALTAGVDRVASSVLSAVEGRVGNAVGNVS